MGNNFRKTLNKDADFVKVQKEINALNKDMEKLIKKSDSRVSKLISEMIPEAISHHKWRLSVEEVYVPRGNCFFESHSLAFCIADEDETNSSHAAVAIPLKYPRKKRMGSTAQGFSKKTIRLNKGYNDSSNFWGLYRLCDEFDSYVFKYKKVWIGISSGGNIVIGSKKSHDDVYDAAKSLGIKLDMKSHLEYIEGLEEQIRKTKALVSDLSANMLFNL